MGHVQQSAWGGDNLYVLVCKSSLGHDKVLCFETEAADTRRIYH